MYHLLKTACLFLIAACLLGSCVERLNKPTKNKLLNPSESQIDSVLEEINFSYQAPLEPDSSDYLIFPLSAYSGSKNGSNLISSSKSGYRENYSGYWNLFFFHPVSQESHLLTQSKMVIGEYLINIPEAGPILSKSILLTIRDTDYNQDGALTYLDPKYLYLAKQDGTELIRISPENEDLLQYKILSQKDEIVFQTQKDLDQDGKFSEEDPSIWYYINLNTVQGTTQILNPKQEKDIERLFFEQWVNNPKK